MSVVAIESGNGSGRTANVNDDGRLTADVEELQRIVEPLDVAGIADPVTTRPQALSVANVAATATSSSSEVVAARSGRRWLEIQNLGAFPVHIRFSPDTDPAVTSGRKIDAGGVYSWPGGVSYDGAVQALAVGGNSALAITEFHGS